jgi:hypothetical protein
VSDIPLEVERRFSDPIRIELGCESFEKGELVVLPARYLGRWGTNA